MTLEYDEAKNITNIRNIIYHFKHLKYSSPIPTLMWNSTRITVMRKNASEERSDGMIIADFGRGRCRSRGRIKRDNNNAGAVLIITSDISLYEPSERRMPMLDCGLFIMNLVYAFYEKQIGTCILNGSFNLEREKEIRNVAPIPDNEMYAAVIALSKIPDGEDIRVAHSVKRDVKDIVEVL